MPKDEDENITVRLSDLKELPASTRLSTVRAHVRLIHMTRKIEKELAR